MRRPTEHLGQKIDSVSHREPPVLFTPRIVLHETLANKTRVAAIEIYLYSPLHVSYCLARVS